jgi:hypothetical protein
LTWLQKIPTIRGNQQDTWKFGDSVDPNSYEGSCSVYFFCFSYYHRIIILTWLQKIPIIRGNQQDTWKFGDSVDPNSTKDPVPPISSALVITTGTKLHFNNLVTRAFPALIAPSANSGLALYMKQYYN